MYIVRWLTGHPMIAVWVLGAIAILLSYGSAEKEDQKVEKEVVTSEAPAVVTTDTTSADDTKNVDNVRVENLNNANTLSINSSQGAIDTDKAVMKGEGKTLTKPVNQGGANIKEEGLPSTSLNVASTTNAKGNDNEQVVEEAAKESKTNQTSSQDVSNTNKKESLNNSDSDVADLGQLSSEEMLKMAREAYWNNGLDEAAKIYQQLIKSEPKVIEHRGELGNVFWRQGYPKRAAEIYSEIAIPMIENGNSDRVANMIGFIGLFYPDRASVIHDRLQNTNSKIE